MAAAQLSKFEPSKAGRYDPGAIVVFFDNRTFRGFEDKLPWYQTYYLSGLSKMSWSSFVAVTDLSPGYVRLYWYTHVGNEGHRDFPTWKATAVKEMFDSLSEQGFRPMIIGWSAENPFPMIGGLEPAPPPKKKEPKRATTWSNAVSGHTDDGQTVHDRVMKIIEHEEEIEAKARRDEFELGEKGGLLSAV